MRVSRSPCRISSASIVSMPTASPDCRPRWCSTRHWPSPVHPCCCPARRAAVEVFMSFILDALKKSEIERQRQSVPGLMDTRLSPKRNRLPLWAIALGVLLGINLLGLTYVLLRKSTPAVQAPRPADAARAPAAGAAPAETRPFSPLDSAPEYAPEIPVAPAASGTA